MHIEEDRFLALAEAASAAVRSCRLGPLRDVIAFLWKYPTVVNSKGGVVLATASRQPEYEMFLHALLSSYENARHARVNLNPVKTIADPAVDTVLSAFRNVTAAEAAKMSLHHRDSMAAENIIGSLLERYVAEQVEPLGWIWCCGELMIGVDFFKSRPSTSLLQLKNRYNSENSSSSRIRELVKQLGCPVKIEKWFRTAANGSTCWHKFPDPAAARILSEEGFRKFLNSYPKRSQPAKA